MVEVENRTEDAITAVALPRGELVHGLDPRELGLGPTPARLLTSYWVDIGLQGDDARRLSGDARLVVEGVTAPLPNGYSTQCVDTRSPPEVKYPRDIRTESCWIGVKISRIAGVDSADGHVLKEWRR
jgi:hypothetical protein